MHDIIFKDISTKYTGLITKDLGSRQKAQEQVDIYSIPYRNEDLIIHSNTYKPYTRNIEFTIRDKRMISFVNRWLSGSGRLVIEDDLKWYNGSGYYKASVAEGWDYEKYSHDIYNFTVQFNIEPFFYYDNGNELMTITTPKKITNAGTIYSEPYIRINGNGNIDLTLNSKVFSFTDVVDYIEIDSTLMLAYKDTTNQGEKMVGDFPRFEVGNIDIAWAGDVASIQYRGNWRDI